MIYQSLIFQNNADSRPVLAYHDMLAAMGIMMLRLFVNIGVNLSKAYFMWICYREQSHHWFRYWLVNCSVASHQWTQSCFLSTEISGTCFRMISIGIQTFQFMKMHLKLPSVYQWQISPYFVSPSLIWKPVYQLFHMSLACKLYCETKI